MLELFPEGFEEVDRTGSVELVAYTDAGGEERLWHAFGGARGADVDSGWEDRWRDFHRPVRVGRVWVGPPWETPPDDLLAVVVDPGRAFGTGAHPTTRLCLELIQELDPASLLDVGCGSGVLSIAAWLLGFTPVLAVDTEEAAVAATLANAATNSVELDVRLVAADEVLPAARIVVANISLASVSALAPRVEAEWIVTSGYLASEIPEPVGYAHAGRRVLEGWAADLHARG